MYVPAVGVYTRPLTNQKLRPFFPPLEPLQSVNLRNALFRVLSDVKKNGGLGRETILRKSMLDDCRGEKFDELLAVFSTAVLRKVLTASSDDGLLNPALRLSLAKGLRPDEYQLMVPLILAHRVSLGAMAERRVPVKNTHEKFSELLDNKRAELDSRSKENRQVAAGEPAGLNDLSREVKANWLSSEEWANALLYGGSRSSSDAFLELPFSNAWSKANASSIGGLSADTSQDLLADLESRVSRQRNRLRRWHDYKDTIRKRERLSGRVSMNAAGHSPLLFKDHQTLTVASISKAVRQPEGCSYISEDDQLLLSSMDEALSRISGKHPSTPTPNVAHTHDMETKPVAAETGERENSAPFLIPKHEEPLDQTETFIEASQHASPSPEPPTNKTDSPTVKISEPEPEPEADPDTVPEPEPEKPNTFTLAERARKSMSLIPPTTKRPQKPQSRKTRPSFPVNQFETPRKQSSNSNEASAQSGRSTPRDELFDDNADYASVFKSRPRVANSPTISPAVHVSPVEFDMDDGGDYDGYDVESPYGGGYGLASSPLAYAGPRR